MKIKALKIYTQNLAEQVDFYSKKIGLKLIEQTNLQATFQVGESRMTLEQNDDFQPYHFAINIPCNQEHEALEWLKERVEILKDGVQEIQDFHFWNAKAMYFYDIDQNIVEFIARKNLKNESNKAFSANSLLEISEIGMPVNDIETAFTTLKQITAIEQFDGGFERFCAIGGEHGLFICINKDLKDWFPTGDKAHSSAFEIKIQEQGRDYELEFIDGEIKAVAS